MKRVERESRAGKEERTSEMNHRVLRGADQSFIAPKKKKY
jgi:hypothetical protein